MACAAITLVVGTLLGALFGQKARSLGKKYYWNREEEAKLFELCQKGVIDPQVLAKELGRKPRAVFGEAESVGSCGGEAEFPTHNHN